MYGTYTALRENQHGYCDWQIVKHGGQLLRIDLQKARVIRLSAAECPPWLFNAIERSILFVMVEQIQPRSVEWPLVDKAVKAEVQLAAIR